MNNGCAGTEEIAESIAAESSGQDTCHSKRSAARWICHSSDLGSYLLSERPRLASGDCIKSGQGSGCSACTEDATDLSKVEGVEEDWE